jgi:peptidoglycan-N-acetylglucosamine deacetylase
MTMSRPIASLSLDLDNKWSYMKTHGDKGWESFPSYLDVVVPRALSMLKAHDLSISFMIVGQDAALDKNHEAMARIPAAGHEIGNHSFHHEQWFHLGQESEIEAELTRAEEQIERATGRRPIGFRGPGFVLSRPILDVLSRRGYLYDASTLPTYLGPLARAYYFMTSKLTPEEREKRKGLFGGLRDGLRPIDAYRWNLGESRILEIPVTTMPGLKVPIHVSYALYVGVFSLALAKQYFRTAMAICRATGTSPSILLHPLDFLGKEDEPDLSFFPAMGLPRERKLEIVDSCLGVLAREFEVLSLEAHARRLSDSEGLRAHAPVFSVPA